MESWAEQAGLILLGVFVAQSVNYLASKRRVHKIIKLHIEELKQLSLEVDRLTLIFERQLQIASLGGINQSFALPIKAPIYAHHYSDIMAELNIDQRISYQMIHTQIDSLNQHLAEAREFIANLPVLSKPEESDFEKYAQSAHEGFLACKVISWHISYHLNNQSKPALGYKDKKHQEFLQYYQDVYDEATAIKTHPSADLSPDFFEKIYDPSAFGNGYFNSHGERI